METLEQTRGLLGKIAGAELYRNNPFRRLGLSVLASPREVAKRCDQLRLSTELGISDSKRAFAPSRPPGVDQVRESAQQLQDPTQRLLFEFFWFWPIEYPESGDDPGLVALEKGDSEEAFACWCRALAQGRPAALHNMAVYFHLIALDWDLDDPRAARSDEEIWGPALKYWLRVQQGDGIWDRLRLRTQGQVDSGMLGNFPSELRTLLPAALAGINAQWALIFSERGLFERATQHSNIVLGLHGDPAEGRRALEACTPSCVRRLDARVAECRRGIEAAGEELLSSVLGLLSTCEPDLRIIEGFCGPGSQRARELCQGLCACALDALVSYQRKTQDNQGSLPLFLHLLDKPATTDLLKRASDAFEVVYSNAIVSGRLSEGEAPSDSACRLLVGCLLPSERILNFSTSARALYRVRFGALLARLSESSAGNPLAANLGARALAAAAALLQAPSGSPAALTPWVLEAPGCLLSIGPEGISLNGMRVPLRELVGLRYGLPAHSAPLLAWSSFTEAWELDFSALGAAPADILPLYTSAVVAVEHFVRPVLALTLLGWLRTGENVSIGELQLLREGLRTSSDSSAILIPFAHLLAGQDASSLHLSSRHPNSFSATLDCASVWNAAIIAQVIDTLAGDVETNANDRARIPSPGPRA